MVQLGFLDEPITDFHSKEVDFTTNKIGGFPDWVDTKNTNKKITCNVCNSVTPLLLQVYAPITERAHYHRTLYIFACINVNCWSNPKSWRCIKSQISLPVQEKRIIENRPTFTLNDWPAEADDWGCDDVNNINEPTTGINEATAMINRVAIDEENANESPDVAFIGTKSYDATAEIEPDENEPITVDSPVLPNCNLINLLKLKPSSPRIHNENTHFTPWFIYAIEEKIDKDPLSEHVQNLLSEYTKNKDNQNCLKVMNNVNVVRETDEKYEKSFPPHGDKLFHTFMSRVKANPDQILRYSRSNCAPLFLYEESNIPTKCKYCHSDLIFEMQILPTLINYLKLSQDNRNPHQYLEFASAFVYTCKASCEKSEEENVIVQYEQF